MRYFQSTNHNDILRLKGILDDKVYRGPKYLTFDITEVCNINCIYCPVHSPLVKSSKFKHLPFEIIKRTIKEAKELGIEEITISGDGEPSLHPQIKEIIDCLNCEGTPYGFATNATCLEEKGLIPYLLTADFIDISLSAADPKSYKSIHSPYNKENLFNKVIQNIGRLILAKGNSAKPKIILVFIITNKNISDMKRVCKLANSFGIKKVEFIPMIRIAKELKPLELSNKDIGKMKRILMDLAQETDMTGSNLDLLNYLKSADLGYDLKRCFLGWFYTFVTAWGEVGFCCDRTDLVAGSLYKNTLKEIWENKEYQQLRLKGKYNFNLKEESWQVCKFCDIFGFNKTIEKILKARNLKHNEHKAN